jgi:hypothetical protein
VACFVCYSFLFKKRTLDLVVDLACVCIIRYKEDLAMSQQVSFTVPEREQIVEMLRHLTAVHQGYALALAQKAGLSASEAVQIFMLPYMDYLSAQHYEPNPQLLEQQAYQNAATLAIANGSENVQLEKHETAWLITTHIADSEALTRYGVTLEDHMQWLYEQLRAVGDPKGIAYKIWLESETQFIQLSLKSDK